MKKDAFLMNILREISLFKTRQTTIEYFRKAFVQQLKGAPSIFGCASISLQLPDLFEVSPPLVIRLYSLAQLFMLLKSAFIILSVEIIF